MDTIKPAKIKSLFTNIEPGRPITAAGLEALGISKHLKVYYVRSGWLSRLARGIYSRLGDTLALYPSLSVLETLHPGLHVGGKTALEWQGVRHYVTQQSVLQLYGSRASRLPGWFTSRFPAEYHRKRLFDEADDAMLHVSRLNQDANKPRVSEPERAWLELLSEVGLRQPIAEARELAASTHTMRAQVMRTLLTHCTSVKTVRLCLQLGREVRAPWAAKLDSRELPTGSSKPWVARTREGLLVLPP
jgi:hypothetical protein